MRIKHLLAMVFATLMSLYGVACDDDDDTADDIDDATEEAGDEIEDTADDIGDEVEEAAELRVNDTAGGG